MGLGRKLGKSMLLVSHAAKRMGEGMDMVFGEDRTRPGDGFSKDRTAQRAANFTKQARKGNKGSLKSEEKEREKRDFF